VSWFLLALVLGLTAATGVASQLPDIIPGTAEGPLTERPRFHTAFSATATTIVRQRTEGGRVDRTATARFYRDSNGRVRIEYTPLEPAGKATPMAAVVPNPFAPKERLFIVDDAAKTIELTSHDIFRRMFGPREFILPTGPRRFTAFATLDVHVGPGSLEELGARVMEGLTVTGRRLSNAGKVDERWESEALGLVLEGRHATDGIEIEYVLTNIQRAEPPSRLFVLPPEYRYLIDPPLIVEAPEAERRRQREGSRPAVTDPVIADILPPDPIPGTADGPLSERPRFRAPFSATATTIVRETEGERRVRTATARYYRDGNGRIRIEYTPVGPPEAATTITVVVPNPYAPTERLFRVDDDAKTIELSLYGFFRQFFFGPRVIALPVDQRRFVTFTTPEVFGGPGYLEELGTRTMAGLTVTGRRLSEAGKVDERWEDDALGLVIAGRHTQEGYDVEYRLSNIQRGEPPARLFVLSPDYRYRTEGGVGAGVSPPEAVRRLQRK
jgi:hypothetical protein